MRNLIPPFACCSILVFGCGQGPALGTLMAECHVVSTPLSEYDWEGLNESDVLTALKNDPPSLIVWDKVLSPTESPMRLAWARTEDGPTVETRSGSGSTCRPGPELMLPVEFDVDLDDGCVVGSLEGELGTDEKGTVFVSATGSVALCETLEKAATEEAPDTGDPETIEYHLTIIGEEWERAGVGLWIRSSHHTQTLARGHWE